MLRNNTLKETISISTVGTSAVTDIYEPLLCSFAATYEQFSVPSNTPVFRQKFLQVEQFIIQFIISIIVHLR